MSPEAAAAATKMGEGMSRAKREAPKDPRSACAGEPLRPP